MTTDDDAHIVACNISCLIVQIYCLLYELIDLKSEGIMVYFAKMWNCLDFMIIIIYFTYFVFRVQNPIKLIPKTKEEFLDKDGNPQDLELWGSK